MSRISKCCMTFVLALALVRCADTLVAPVGGKITIAANPTQIFVDGDTSVVTVFLTESDGLTVPNNTQVILSASNGGFCATTVRCTSGNTQSVFAANTTNGIATVKYASGIVPGEVSITGTSGSVAGIVKLTTSGLAAPANTSAVVALNPDTARVAQSAVFSAYLQSNSQPVPDGIRVALTIQNGSLSRSIVRTSGGFFEVSAVPKDTGKMIITMASGSFRSSASFSVR